MKASALILSFMLVTQAIFGLNPEHNDYGPSYIDRSTEFEIETFKTIAQSYPDSNLVFSPFDTQLVLSMAANILADNEARHISDILGFDSVIDLNKHNSKTIGILTDSVSKYIIPSRITNTIRFRSDIPQTYIKALMEYYNAQINLSKLSSDIGIEIKPSFYFNQQWDGDYHFFESYKDKFMTPQGYSETDFMDADIIARYFSSEQLQSVILKLSKYQMLLIMPNRDTTLIDLIQNFDVRNYLDIINKATPTAINLTLPRFNNNCELSLIPFLKKLGFHLSDFKVPIVRNNKIKIDQTSTISVNQIGVAAGSATVLTVIVSEPPIKDPIELKFNRPFIYFIIEPETQAILMAGQYAGPEK